MPCRSPQQYSPCWVKVRDEPAVSPELPEEGFWQDKCHGEGWRPLADFCRCGIYVVAPAAGSVRLGNGTSPGPSGTSRLPAENGRTALTISCQRVHRHNQIAVELFQVSCPAWAANVHPVRISSAAAAVVSANVLACVIDVRDSPLTKGKLNNAMISAAAPGRHTTFAEGANGPV